MEENLYIDFLDRKIKTLEAKIDFLMQEVKKLSDEKNIIKNCIIDKDYTRCNFHAKLKNGCSDCLHFV